MTADCAGSTPRLAVRATCVQVAGAEPHLQTDVYHPYTDVDERMLSELGLPSPLELDDMLPMQHVARSRGLEAKLSYEKALAGPDDGRAVSWNDGSSVDGRFAAHLSDLSAI